MDVTPCVQLREETRLNYNHLFRQLCRNGQANQYSILYRNDVMLEEMASGCLGNGV